MGYAVETFRPTETKREYYHQSTCKQSTSHGVYDVVWAILEMTETYRSFDESLFAADLRTSSFAFAPPLGEITLVVMI